MADFVLIGIRFALFANLMLVAGLAAFLLYAFNADERADPNVTAGFRTAERRLCWSGLLISAAGLGVLTASMNGVGLLEIDPPMLFAMIGETGAGTAWLYRTAALLIALAASWGLAQRAAPSAAVILAAGSIALATLVWSGHAGATEGAAGTLHRASDALHMIAAAVWLGGIAAFLLLLQSPEREAGAARLEIAVRTLDQFARVGTICVIVIAATGLLNGHLIVGVENFGRLTGTPYGQLLLAKLALFVLMLALAAANRWRLTPALAVSLADPEADASRAAAAIRRSLFLEAAAGAAILALVAWFGLLEPIPAPGAA
ncbi:MAG: copper homeostasis membrane protein CopD [Sphingopyxis sp.]|nr:copper homeostasis membrane protein CopD [Sphingopyxis sp.]